MLKNNRIWVQPAHSSAVFWGFFVFFILAVILTGHFAFSTARKVGASGMLTAGGLPNFVGSPSSTLPALVTETIPTATTAPPAPVVWDGATRVTALIMGLDYGDWDNPDRQGPPRTDTMILLTIDPLTKSAGIMNIPRDLWVNIPGFDYGKINTAYPLGESWQYPGGGPGLAMDTVEQFLGVPIDFYALIDFTTFERFVDEMGGIEVDVPAEIKVDPMGKGNTVVLQPGKQMLDGPVSLAYARARNSEGVDFDRAGRQQQVIMGMRDRVLKLDMLPTLAAKAPALYAELQAGIKTNMTLDQALSLAWLAVGVEDGNIKRGVISPPDHVIMAKSPDGSMDILKPISANIRLLRDAVFASQVPLSPEADQATTAERMALEGARITVLNGSGVGGLANSTAEYLKAAGANVVATGDAGEFYPYTTVFAYSGKPYTLAYLSELMALQPQSVRYQTGQSTEFDVVIYLGSDWAGNNPMP